MKKIYKIIISALIIFILIFLSVFTFFKFRYLSIKKKDALEFKIAYEELNDTIRSSDGVTYSSITISEDNPIKNITAQEATKLLKNGTGIIYFGANWCPWCRLAIPVLFESAKQNNIDTIYYLNVDSLTSGFKVQDGKLIRNEDEISEGYINLISSLDKVLRNTTYKITDNDGNIYDTGEKFISAPLVITIKKGIITSYHLGAINLNESQTKYDTLTDKQSEKLLDYYNKMFDTIK